LVLVHFGVQLGSRGEVLGPECMAPRSHASMGPRLGSRGEIPSAFAVSAPKCWLQWGHGLVAVERAYTVRVFVTGTGLQWGHGLVAVESRANGPHGGGGRAASMGPRLGSRGESLSPVSIGLHFDASMGPRLGSRGEPAQSDVNDGEDEASMGPRLGSRGE